jgi:hypothetical protein
MRYKKYEKIEAIGYTVLLIGFIAFLILYAAGVFR